MDTSQQVYESAATGWQRGLYDDIRATFRAPVVNWIWRTLLANDPEFTRLLWGQVKPTFETRAFGRYTREYRGAVLDPLAADAPRYRPGDVEVSPAEWRELRGQLATFDVVVPRLAALFELVSRSLAGDPVATTPDGSRAATAPMPAHLDRDRGLSPTLADADDVSGSVADTVASVRSFHGFETGLPSVYRCLLQWPSFFERLWADAGQVLDSSAFDRVVETTGSLAAEFVDGVPSRPRLAPADLAAAGMDDARIEALADLFTEFAHGPVKTVLPAVPVYAAAVGSEGAREP